LSYNRPVTPRLSLPEIRDPGAVRPTSETASPQGFVVQLPVFRGTLSELASALRAGRLAPGEVPLLRLTREVLAWAAQVGGGDVSALARRWPELLPTLAGVIALKARLLLPPPDAEPALPGKDSWDEDAAQDLAGGVEALAELDRLVGFLAARRREREGLIPGRAAPVDLPHREARRTPGRSLARLVQAAQNAVRQVEVPLLSRERLTLADALRSLVAFGERLRHFTFRGVPAQGWGERTTYFSALLEGVKEGQFQAEQTDSYGEIRIVATRPEAEGSGPLA
jgi:segregation and condensation protein A